MTIDHLIDLAIKIATLVGVIAGILATRRIHIMINSRLSQLLVSEGGRQRAEGREEGRAERTTDRPAGLDRSSS
jgi:hypothetical protein